MYPNEKDKREHAEVIINYKYPNRPILLACQQPECGNPADTRDAWGHGICWECFRKLSA